MHLLTYTMHLIPENMTKNIDFIIMNIKSKISFKVLYIELEFVRLVNID